MKPNNGTSVTKLLFTAKTGAGALDNLIEYRREPRFRTDFSAEVKCNSGEVVSATVTNLSQSGLQLSGDHRLTRTVMPTIKRDDRPVPIDVSVHFAVPTTTAAAASIELRCKIVYCRRQGASRFILGCDVFERHCEDDLKDYIEHFGERL